jgi:hypothetical protein
MTTINKRQGNVKASEVSVDTAKTLVNTQENEDFFTLLQYFHNFTNDSLRRVNTLLKSQNIVSWQSSLNRLYIPAPNYLSFKIFLNGPDSNDRVVELLFTVASDTTFTINNNETVFLEVSRAVLNSAGPIAMTDGINFTGTVGQRIVKKNEASVPYLSDPHNGSPESTLLIPILKRINSGSDDNLYWLTSGIVWSNGVTAPVGSSGIDRTIPVGTILGIHVPGITNAVSPVDQAWLDSYAPGWALCNYQIITNPASIFFNKRTPDLNTNGRFIIGSRASGAVVGAHSVALTNTQMPVHQHSIGLGGTHYHDVQSEYNQSNPDPNTHHIWIRSGSDNGGDARYPASDSSDNAPFNQYYEFPAYTHTHTIGYQGGIGAANSPSNGAAHENRPPFYSVVYIIKII